MTLFAGAPVAPLIESGAIAIEGEAGLYERLIGLLEAVDTNFPVVTP
jgi:alkyl sulfatase BDS1-like metallo-beta-lactamase superfamily hydrolase